MSFTDEEWDDIAQDIPSTEDPFLQQYVSGRANLIGQEKSSRSDASFRTSLSPLARKACSIVDRIRNLERDTVWTAKLEDEYAQETHQAVFPGMMFMQAKERMETTRLWNIVRRMPKGALLHAHLDAMVDFDFLLGELLRTPGMHMSSDRSLSSPDARPDAAMQFRFRKQENTDGPTLWSPDYKPDTFILLSKVADEFPEGGRDGFVSWLKSRCTLGLVDSHEHHHGIDAIWRKFMKCFVVVSTILAYEPIWRAFLNRMMTLLKADGVNWAEVR